MTLSPSTLRQWADSIQNITLATTSYTTTNTADLSKTTTTTTATTYTYADVKNWDKTLSWEKTLPQVNLLKSVGNGSEVFVRPNTNNISRKEPVQLTIRL